MSRVDNDKQPVAIEYLTNRFCRIDILDNQPIDIDMGCGKGGFLLELARRHPERLVIGSDVMVGRLRKVASLIEQAGLNNVRLLRANNRELVEYQLPDKCVTRLHILCPDPWPKARHRDRRLLNSDSLFRIPRIMKDGGIIHISTDDEAYLKLIRCSLAEAPQFKWMHADAIEDVVDIETEFEKQWKAAGKKVEHIVLKLCRNQT
ncbi:MAG: methyltransferase domain-containing protein [Lentisphaeria bacterium]